MQGLRLSLQRHGRQEIFILASSHPHYTPQPTAAKSTSLLYFFLVDQRVRHKITSLVI